MHTWIFGGGLVRDDDGAKGIVLRRAPLGASRALAKSALLARFWRLAQILLGAAARCRIQGFRGWPSCCSSLRASALTTR